MIDELHSFLGQPFTDMVKFVIDVDRKIIALGGELHSDAEEILINNGSRQENLWGGNVFPFETPTDKIEHSSLINIRPAQNNRTILISDKNLTNKIEKILNKLLPL